MPLGDSRLSRRSLLRALTLAGAGMAVLGSAACSSQPTGVPEPTSIPATAPAPAAVPTTVPASPVATASAATPTGPATVAARTTPAAQAAVANKTYAGTQLKLMITTHPYTNALKSKLGDFKQETGIDVQIDDISFDVLNQRADLELSSGSGTYDMVQLIFIRSGRWIGAGWVEDLMPYINNPKLTDQKALDLPDFVAGSLNPFQRGNNQQLYALPWLTDSTMVAYREDIFKQAGYDTFPATYDDFQKAAPKIQESTGGKVKAFVTQNNLHWIWPNWLMSYGGNFFQNPPTDLHPQFTTPAAHTSAQMFTDLLAKYSPAGGANLQPDVAELQIQEGNAASYLDGLGNLQTAIDPKKSKYRDNIRFIRAPTGPAGWFPQLAVHGLGINKASSHKEASWLFISWATSKEMQLYAALDDRFNHIANTRASMLTNPDVVKKFSWHGDNIPQLHLDVMKQAGQGYMIFRTIPQFPPVGDRVIIALTAIASGQQTVDAALQSLQKDVTDILRKQGVQI